MRYNNWKQPHHPNLSWDERVAERLPMIAQAIKWCDAAIADGWVLSPTYKLESVDTAFTLKKGGWYVIGIARMADKLLGQGEIAAWSPDGTAVPAPLEYNMADLEREAQTCQFCGLYPTKLFRVAFASGACAECQPKEQAKLPRNWAD